jgi:type IV pilus assembly protein PilY1
MNTKTYARQIVPSLASLLLVAGLILPHASLGAALTLATAPLANSTNTTVLPNLMFILDNSGSMGYDYLPDWAGDRPSNVDSSGEFSMLNENAAFNAVYYNPAIRYDPPVFFNSDGSLNTTAYPSQTGTSSSTGADTSRSTPNWRSVPDDGYGVQFTSYYGSTSKSNLEGNASFYTFVAGEYCTTPSLTTCATQSAPSATYPYAAPLRWCSNTSLTNCQRTNTSTYKYVRYAGQVLTTGTAATGRISISNISGTNRITSIKVNGQEILSGTVSYSGNTERNLANDIVDAINDCTNNTRGNCQAAGYSASRSGNGSNVTVIVTAPVAMGNLTAPLVVTRTSGSGTISPGSFSGGSTGTTVPGSNILTIITSSVGSYPYPGSATKAATRTDCAGSTCTYAEEMTNYANWWAYYHTRMQAMKTSVSRAFKNVDNRYRVGYSTISYTGGNDGTNFQHIDKFELSQKNAWFTKLFSADPNGNTPLRGALAKAGLIYAHKLSGAADPIQYSCQQNFTILSTDGYWTTSGDDIGPKGLNGSSVGDMDGGSTERPMYEGPTTVSNSLADVAKYYYDTDLRTSDLGNCTGAVSGVDVCDNNVFVSSTDNNVKQHMTTFTIGLGVDGVLNYSSDYTTIKKDTSTTTYPAPTTGSIDFYNLINGYGSPTVNWPDPQTSSSSQSVVARIDDLWHAAVNGHGVYFSASNPDTIYAGFQQALASIESRIGAGAAAATSTLNPVAGDNSAFVASYTTVKWIGNLEARSIDTVTGAVSESAIWCAENVVASDTGATTCSGTMASKVGASTDSRTIYMNDDGSLVPFNSSNVSDAGLSGYFNSTYLSTRLSQWSTLTSAQQSLAAANLINFLRGQYGYEDRSSNTDRLYRSRDAVLGDATESKPAYVGKPTFSYADPGYSAFVSAHASRAGTVYIGTNDGMLHAFDASNGNERWAFIPTAVFPNLWKLADKNYATMHTNYVNGSPVVSDICTANCGDAASAVWKTILVFGLNGGGRSYYAIDITDPTAPSLLWEFSASDDSDLGYTFGNPVVTKKADGTWVVLVTSGYDNGTVSGDGSTNNAIAGDGKGYLYVLNATTGAVISKLGTGVGSAATPSGLGKIAAWADHAVADNTATYVYGGDLQGNVWRFDINAAASSSNPFKFATLSDSGGSAQPITARPELGSINGKRVVFIGTGKYLEVSDLSNTQQQSIYAILDDNATATLVNPRTTLTRQTLTTAGATRTASNNAVDFSAGRGWFVDLPDSGERQNVDGKLESGTLLVPTTVPADSVCSPGGYSWLNFFNYQTGGPVDTETDLVSSKTNAPIVGINVYYINGTPVVSQVTADSPTPEVNTNVVFRTQASSFQKKKVIWRELIQ